MEYKKPALSIQDQLSLLKERKLIIPDEQRASKYLTFIGYYRLSVYFIPFQKNKDVFDDGTKFDDILNLYILDRKLKLLVLDATERIEVAAKSVISNYMSEKFGPHWFLDPKYFQDKNKWETSKTKLRDAIDKNKNKDHIKHYHRNYGSGIPPSWNCMEISTFGNISHLFANLRGKHKQRISKEFEITAKLLEDSLRALVNCRNLCAHHERFWNSIAKYTFKDDSVKLICEGFKGNKRMVFLQLWIINFFMRRITTGSSWEERVLELLKTLPEGFQERHMGFPKNFGLSPQPP